MKPYTVPDAKDIPESLNRVVATLNHLLTLAPEVATNILILEHVPGSDEIEKLKGTSFLLQESGRSYLSGLCILGNLVNVTVGNLDYRLTAEWDNNDASGPIDRFLVTAWPRTESGTKGSTWQVTPMGQGAGGSDSGAASNSSGQDPARVEFDKGYADAMQGKPSQLTSLDYTRGYARGVIGREIVEAEQKRSSRRVVPVGPDPKPEPEKSDPERVMEDLERIGTAILRNTPNRLDLQPKTPYRGGGALSASVKSPHKDPEYTPNLSHSPDDFPAGYEYGD